MPRNILPTAPRIPSLGVDALYAVRGQPGAASNYYKFSTDPNSPYNIFGNRYLGKLQADWAKGITSGGNKQIHKILTGLGTSKTGSKQGFVKRNPNVGKLFAQYFRTGVVPRGLTPDLARHAYDYALRATGRDAVMDRQGSFFGNLVKGNLGAIAGTALGVAVPGLGMALGGALGGAIQGGVSGGLKGAALGGLGGYGLGSGASWLAGKAGTLAGNAAQSLGAHKLGAAISPKVTNLNALLAKNAPANSFFNSPSFAARTSTGMAAGHAAAVKAAAKRVAAGNAVPGARTGINTALPQHGGGLSPVSAASQKGLGKAVIDSAATRAALKTGASKMATWPWLTNVTSGVKDFAKAAKPFVQGANTILDAAKFGTAAYNYFNPVTGKSQMDDLTNRIAGLYGDPSEQLQPYNVTTPLSQIQFENQNVNVNPSTGAMQTFDQYMDMLQKTGRAASNVDLRGLSASFYDQLNALTAQQEAEELDRVESVLFDRQGIHTGTGRQVADFRKRIDDARQARQFDAINAALDYQGRLYNQFNQLAGGVTDFNTGIFNPFAQVGGSLGAMDTTASQNAAQSLTDIYDKQAAQAYLDDRQERDYLNDALLFGADFLGGLA